MDLIQLKPQETQIWLSVVLILDNRMAAEGSVNKHLFDSGIAIAKTKQAVFSGKMWLCKKVFTSQTRTHTHSLPLLAFFILHWKTKKPVHLLWVCRQQSMQKIKASCLILRGNKKPLFPPKIIFNCRKNLYYILNKTEDINMHEEINNSYLFMQKKSPNGQKNCINVQIAGWQKTERKQKVPLFKCAILS